MRGCGLCFFFRIRFIYIFKGFSFKRFKSNEWGIFEIVDWCFNFDRRFVEFRKRVSEFWYDFCDEKILE